MTNETLILICWELYEQRITKKQIAKRLGKHRETIYLWIRGIQELGLLGFLDKYRIAKKGERKRRQVDPIIKRWVWEIRDREYDCCGQKIQYFLEREKKVLSPYLKSTRFWLRSILSVLSGRKISKEARSRQLMSHDK